MTVESVKANSEINWAIIDDEENRRGKLSKKNIRGFLLLGYLHAWRKIREQPNLQIINLVSPRVREGEIFSLNIESFRTFGVLFLVNFAGFHSVFRMFRG